VLIINVCVSVNGIWLLFEIFIDAYYHVFKSDEALGGVMLNKKMHGGADLFTFGDNGKKKDKGKKPAKAAGKVRA
jgi:hypothetical protein